ncbi:phage distal tail protein [Actinomadura sediminis]|uniref:Siphovirus-type tail component C-terminal domain-containing protein n=1 Tax=Actinomadura sediminis TaxID=1038904 RepID=A0ABW3EUB7_9ACTN
MSLQDGAREMVLLPRQSDGIFLQGLSAPMPEVREVSENRTEDDGVRDETMLFGSRAVSIELLVTQDPRGVEDELARYLHPRVRPFLVVEDDGWSQARRIRLRVSQFDKPLELDLARIDARKISVGWVAPDGIWEADVAAEETVVADVDTSGDGFSLPVTLPLTLTATQETGASLLTNLGAVPSHFTAKLYGPCTAPSLVNETTGEEITFTSGLTLASGEYVEIDTRERTANLLSNAATTRLHLIDFTSTSWWQLQPGLNQIRYAPAPSEPGAAAIITYRPAWL